METESINEVLGVSMDPNVRYGNQNLAQKAIMRGKLTDYQLNRYIKMGYYTSEARQARKEWRQKMGAIRRNGKFLQMEDGRLVYSP